MTESAFDFVYRVRAHPSGFHEVTGMQVGRYAVRTARERACIQTEGDRVVLTSGYTVDHLDLQIAVVGGLQFHEALSVADSLSLYAADPEPQGWVKCDPRIHQWLSYITTQNFVSYEAWRQKRKLCRLPKKNDRRVASEIARRYSS